MAGYYNDADNLADLTGQMPSEERSIFDKFGHLRVESAFIGRLFIIYRPTGLNPDKTHADPEILTTVRLQDFRCNSKDGSVAHVIDVMTGQSQEITHVPARLFHYPVYVSLPPFSKLRWDARMSGGKVKRSLSYALLVKTRNRSDFYSLGNTYCETPNDFKALFPACEMNLNYA